MSSNRVSEIYRGVIAALSNVVNDMEITEDELKIAGHFIDRMGQAQLSTNMLNVAFSMQIVERGRRGLKGTSPCLEGPYHVPGAPVKEDGVLYEKPPGDNAIMLEWTGRFLDAETGQPVPGSELDIWHADENGEYDHDGFHLRGIVKPSGDGSFSIKTVVPLDYSEHGDDPIGELFDIMGQGSRRAAHLHVKARAHGYRELTTQLYVPWSDFIDADYVEGAVADDLVMNMEEAGELDGKPFFRTSYDIELQKNPT